MRTVYTLRKLQYDLFFQVSMHICENFFFEKTLFIVYGSMQLDELIPNITLVLHQNHAFFIKTRIWGQKSGFFGRLIAPTMLISARWRYGERCTRYERTISKSLRSVGLKLFVGFTKYEKAGFQNLVGS